MLYPDRDLTRFENKNRIPAQRVNGNALLKNMIEIGDRTIIEVDAQGDYHFNATFENGRFLAAALKKSGSKDSNAIADVLTIYEDVFNHQAFTGRSGAMFGYEGLGSIYWHMVSKLLLAVQENYFSSYEQDPTFQETKKLAEYYYRVRAGIGFNKTPDVYGAFPTDPYSHTPKQAGAQQPGMTGQVKEEILTRFGELGLLVKNGQIYFQPSLLKQSEFLVDESKFEFININGEYETISLAPKSLAFTYCQIPFIYEIANAAQIVVQMTNGEALSLASLELDTEMSRLIFSRRGDIKQIRIALQSSMLLP
ncbi:hypothetical protein [Psychromonas sp. MME2]|uniref:hypothetical protein n=1 Tax=Psychromonas sp. MME2 TaxID=3231033 RepID=UPI00339CBD9A